MTGGIATGRGAPVSLAVPAGAAAAILTAVVLVPVRETAFGNTNAALVQVVVVSAAGSLGGRRAGIATSVAAAMSYNFFLTRPYLSLHVAAVTDVITIGLLLVVGLVVGSFADRRRRTLDRLRGQTDSTERLERIARLLVSELDHAQLCAAVAAELRDELGLRAARWCPVLGATGLPVLERSGWVGAAVHRYGASGYELPASGVELPVEFAGARLGAFELVPEPGVGVSGEQRRVAVALADLLASALARGAGAQPWLS